MSPAEPRIDVPRNNKEIESALALIGQIWSPEARATQLATMQSVNRGRVGHANLLLGAWRSSRIVGAAFANIVPGRTAGVYPPQLVADESEATSTALLCELHNSLAERGVHLAQSLVAAQVGRDQRRLLAAGYQHAADLLYLVSEAGQFPDHPPPLPFEMDGYDPANSKRLERLLEKTYIGSLDCPLVDRLRDPADVLAGYRSPEEFEPRLWLIATHRGEDIGCLLLSDFPSDNQMEIVYLALVPGVRGRGWGIELSRHAQWLARQASRARMVLAVDAANGPAIRMYATCGFGLCEERSAFVKDLRPQIQLD